MGLRGVASAKVTLAAILVLLVPGLVVAYETQKEYATWSNRPAGVLEHWHSLYTSDLPPTPSWNCAYPYGLTRQDGAYQVQMVWIGDYQDPDIPARPWDVLIEARVPLEFAMRPFERFRTNDDAHAFARGHPDLLVLGFTGTYHRGPKLNERMEGFACANLAIVTGFTECAEAILAHEVGHTFGLEHSREGLMRPRDVTCEDRLTPAETSWLVNKYGNVEQPGLLV